MNVSDLYPNLEIDLANVETQLHHQLRSIEPILEETALHLLQAGGKRLRPVFVLLSGTFGNYDRDKLIRAAVALELIHMATLVHDDVVDNADTRRGHPTVKANYGNRLAMYTGDFIFAQALSVLSEIPNVDMHIKLSRAIERMSVGEIEQIHDLFNFDQSMRKYLVRNRRKTALLIEMSCMLGGAVSGAIPSYLNALMRFGYHAGMAFQITDDILDFTASEEKLGKPVGSDFRQGNITAPTLFALRDEQFGTELRELITVTRTDDEWMVSDGTERALALIKSSKGLICAQEMADRYLRKANDALLLLPATEERETLLAMSRFISNRDH